MIFDLNILLIEIGMWIRLSMNALTTFKKVE